MSENVQGDKSASPKVKLRILAVDDERENLRLIARVLGRDHELEVTDSPAVAARWVADDNFDILLADQAMPGMDGLSVARLAKKHNSLLVIVMVSAYADTREVLEAYQHGIVDFVLAKPWAPSELRERIKKAELMGSLRRRGGSIPPSVT